MWMYSGTCSFNQLFSYVEFLGETADSGRVVFLNYELNNTIS